MRISTQHAPTGPVIDPPGPPAILPSRAWYRPDEEIVVETTGIPAAAPIRLYHLGERVPMVPRYANQQIRFGPLAAGCYGVEIDSQGMTTRTAIEVTTDPGSRLRYGFVVDYRPGRDVTGVQQLIRRLHLTGIQFYDWAFRHADLLGGGACYTDALGQPVSLATVRALVDAVHEVGADALGYAAVYAVGNDEWPRWQHLALHTPSGSPYGLGDFLRVVDPAAPEWSDHFVADLTAAIDRIGFDGFHLDQYGYPKAAVRADGVQVDVAASFVTLLEQVATALPTAPMVFNNVNDFPTWRTATTGQRATYIEVWPPHVSLGSLAAVVRRARALAPHRPAVIAAYQHVYDLAPAPVADRSTALTMATLFSHGATHLLTGEADRLLVDPYYVRNHVAAGTTLDLLTRWYDFLVEHDRLLMDPGAADVTGSYTGEYNGDLGVDYQARPVSDEPVAGAVWRRVVQAGGSLVVHLINLTGQTDTLWDAPREPAGPTGPGTLRFRRSGPGRPRVQVADPDRHPRLVDVPVRIEGDDAVAELPEIGWWQLVRIHPATNADLPGPDQSEHQEK